VHAIAAFLFATEVKPLDNVVLIFSYDRHHLLDHVYLLWIAEKIFNCTSYDYDSLNGRDGNDDTAIYHSYSWTAY